MWVADRWTEYEVLDASGGEKLERWGNYYLVRPDPQVIWNTPKGPEWKKPNAIYHRSRSGGGSWEFFDLPEEWMISYGGSLVGGGMSEGGHPGVGDMSIKVPACDARRHFMLKPFHFKHTGLFPEQAVNWDWFMPIIAGAVSKGRRVKVLNLFAYTGGATIAAAAAGAAVTHVDASKGMVNWARENAVLSGLADAPVRWLVDDCQKFVEREIRRGNRYDAIIMDPPSYGRGPRGEIWKMEDHIYEFLLRCREILSDEPLFILVNSYTTGLQSAVLTYMMRSVLIPKMGGHVDAGEVGLPVTSSGCTLPCGAAGRWIAS